jgi:hypothetical protein
MILCFIPLQLRDNGICKLDDDLHHYEEPVLSPDSPACFLM